MTDASEAAAMNLQGAPKLSSHERLIRQRRTRNAGPENTNRLLAREIAKRMRAETARRAPNTDHE